MTFLLLVVLLYSTLSEESKPERIKIKEEESAKVQKDNLDFSYKLLRRGSSLLENPSDLAIIHKKSYWHFFFPIPFFLSSLEADISSPIGITDWNRFTEKGAILKKSDIEYLKNTIDNHPLYATVKIPNFISFRMSKFMFNISLNVIADIDLDIDDVLEIASSGLLFNEGEEKQVNVKVKADVFAYAKSSLGYGNLVFIPKLGHFRVGGNFNIYTGLGGDINSLLTMDNRKEGLTGHSEVKIRAPFDVDSDNIAKTLTFGLAPTFGIDLSFSFISKYLRNVDFRVSFIDLLASVNIHDIYSQSYQADIDTSKLDIRKILSQNIKIEDVYSVTTNEVENVSVNFSIAPQFKFSPLWIVSPNYIVETTVSFYLKEGINNTGTIDFHLVNHLMFNPLQIDIGVGIIRNYFFLPFAFGFNFDNFEFLINTSPYFNFNSGLNLQGFKFNLILVYYFPHENDNKK